jgi:hypothetical protein
VIHQEMETWHLDRRDYRACDMQVMVLNNRGFALFFQKGVWIKKLIFLNKGFTLFFQRDADN